MKSKLKILVSGMIAGVPHQGGATWAVLQYLLGFKRLGHEVYFIEPLKKEALLPGATTLARSENAEYFHRVMSEAGLIETSALLLERTQETVGLSYDSLERITARADLLAEFSDAGA